MKLGFGIEFGELYERAGLLRVDAAFCEFVAGADGALAERLAAARTKPPAGKEESERSRRMSRTSSRGFSASKPRRARLPSGTTSSPRSTR